MLAKILSYALDGLTGYAVDVEVDINSGLPGYDMVGLASTATKESKERVRSAVKTAVFNILQSVLSSISRLPTQRRKAPCSTLRSRSELWLRPVNSKTKRTNNTLS